MQTRKRKKKSDDEQSNRKGENTAANDLPARAAIQSFSVTSQIKLAVFVTPDGSNDHSPFSLTYQQNREHDPSRIPHTQHTIS